MPAVAGGGKNPKLVESVYSSCKKYGICHKYCLGTMAKIDWCAGKLPNDVEFCEGKCGLKHSDVQIIKSDILRHTGVCCYKEIHGVECPKCADGKCPCAPDRSTADLQAIMVGICPDGESNYENTKNAREAYIAKEKAKLEKAKEKAANKAAEEQRLTKIRVAAVKERVAAVKRDVKPTIVDEVAVEAPVAPAVKTYAAALMRGLKNPANVDEVATEAPVEPAVESVDAEKDSFLVGEDLALVKWYMYGHGKGRWVEIACEDD